LAERRTCHEGKESDNLMGAPQDIYANLTMQIKLSYEYIDSKTLWTLKEEPYSVFFPFAFLNKIAE
jgi:hypothetical protein